MEQENFQVEEKIETECSKCILNQLGRTEKLIETRQVFLIDPKPGLDHEHIDYEEMMNSFLLQTNSMNAKTKILGGMFIIATYKGFRNIKKKVIETQDAILTKINMRKFFDYLDRLERRYPNKYY